MMIRRALAALTGLALLAAAGCTADDRPDRTDASRTLTVLAAASLTESFTTIGREFEATHPGVRVTFTFGGSSALATQITQGAPADVFAAAAPQNMTTVTEAGAAAGAPTVFARNQLVIAVPKDNPGRVRRLSDLARRGTKVAICAEQVPCGAAARAALDASGIELVPATLEQDVKGALAKVRLGEVDAALVYRTDARSVAEVDGIEFPESARAVNDYPIAALREARDPATARAFVDHVTSARGAAVLTAAGFQPPTGS
ncbi:molybdate ABC transporter substrate-binding protein [Micromonospora sp. KC606]|uniref:molybdate ABC transporter substrate-binding protein n=1 Tax=Micromonospora sp. KC606 TaxID=2530379 RepID=UPI00105361D7|nr:molybdate ABC transporter substrate-binding protein [Micromonospora sp. KC606]TDC80477.1 molybdate ABC transporter substrate-binding protein [Micromonospora sp. KC606]